MLRNDSDTVKRAQPGGLSAPQARTDDRTLDGQVPWQHDPARL